MAKYSIVLPVRNGGEYVKECVQSILAQTITDFNLLVLDNCSNDGTIEWVQSIKDDRVKLFLADAPLSIEENWARVITIPKNEFITLIGHDDLLDPNYLLVMERLINEYPDAGLYQTHFRYIDGAGKFKRHCKPMEKVQFAHEFIARHFLNTQDSMGTGYMMRAADYDAFGGIPAYPNLIFADYEIWVRLTARSYKATSFLECFSYREHNSVSKTTGQAKYQQAFGRYVMFLHEMMSKNQQIKETVERYGHYFLMFYCESLSHRLLKTPVETRELKVADFIDQCISYAQKIIPNQAFEPRKVFKIKIAEQFDSSSAGRSLFKLYKTLSS
ncbi:MAG: glycosyltransferase [Sphingobacteriales bacterium]|nr:MAG: glycosyltransferase [Sphingobacteriales bacterium]